MSGPDVSVLMPSFNHERYVVEAVRSVLDQEGVDLELIVVDDGSTDRTLELLRSVDDPRMVLVPRPNRGAHAAFNQALDQARGELVFLINSDDVYAQGHLAGWKQRLENGDGIAVAGDLELIDDRGDRVAVKNAWHDLPPWPPPSREPRLASLDDPRLALLESNWISTTSNFAFRRSAAPGTRFRALRYCHDWDFFLQLARLGPLEHAAEASVRYRVHADNTLREGSSTGRAQMWLEVLWVLVAHGAPLLASYGGEPSLRRRFWGSVPRFGGTGQATQLFALRGDGPEPSKAFHALLDPGDPVRRALLSALESAPEPDR